MSHLSTKIGYIGNKVLGGDLVPPDKDSQRYSNGSNLSTS